MNEIGTSFCAIKMLCSIAAIKRNKTLILLLFVAAPSKSLYICKTSIFDQGVFRWI